MIKNNNVKTFKKNAHKQTKNAIQIANKAVCALQKIKFLELEVVQANAEVERVSSKKLDEILVHQKPFSDKSGLGYTGESSSNFKVTKDMKFVKAKESMIATTNVEKVKPEKKKNVTDQRVLNKPHNQSVVRFKAKANSLPRS